MTIDEFKNEIKPLYANFSKSYTEAQIYFLYRLTSFWTPEQLKKRIEPLLLKDKFPPNLYLVFKDAPRLYDNDGRPTKCCADSCNLYLSPKNHYCSYHRWINANKLDDTYDNLVKYIDTVDDNHFFKHDASLLKFVVGVK